MNFSQIAPLKGYEDWEMRIRRMDAFWRREVLDRVPVWMSYPHPAPRPALPVHLDRHWNQPEYVAQQTKIHLANTVFAGDALPMVTPNIGPDFFPVLYGGELTFAGETSFISHFLTDWTDPDAIRLDWDNPYFRAMDALYDAFIAENDHDYYIGWPDLHGGGDCLAAWRGPEQLCMDLYDHPQEVQQALHRLTGDFFEVFEYFYRKVTQKGHPVTGWPGLVSSEKWHVPSNDFSYMISPEQFNATFLDGLKRESAYFPRSIHHLDGRGCLNHLDAILSIEDLDAVQWVYGDGCGSAADWIEVYQKIQNAGKGIQILARCRDLEHLMATLRPEGVLLNFSDVPNQAAAEHILARLRQWR